MSPPGPLRPCGLTVKFCIYCRCRVARGFGPHRCVRSQLYRAGLAQRACAEKLDAMPILSVKNLLFVKTEVKVVHDTTRKLQAYDLIPDVCRRCAVVTGDY